MPIVFLDPHPSWCPPVTTWFIHTITYNTIPYHTIANSLTSIVIYIYVLAVVIIQLGDFAHWGTTKSTHQSPEGGPKRPFGPVSQ